MANNIALTVRLPYELSNQLKYAAKEIGMTKTNLIRIAIHDFLPAENTILNFSTSSPEKYDRFVLNVNQITYNLLESASKKYNQSINAIITSISFLALERASTWIQSIKS